MSKVNFVSADKLARAIHTTSDPGAKRIVNIFATEQLIKYGDEALKQYIYLKYFLVKMMTMENVEHMPHLKKENVDFLRAIIKYLHNRFSSNVDKNLGYGCHVQEMLYNNNVFVELLEEGFSFGEAFLIIIECKGYKYLYPGLVEECEKAIEEGNAFLLDVSKNKVEPDNRNGCFIIIGFVIAMLIYWIL